MAYLRWLITIPLAVILIVFAINNREAVDVDLWPTGYVVAWPLFVYVFLATAVGLLMGGLFAWISAAPTRQRARERKHRVRELEHTVANMQQRLDDETPKPPAPPPAIPEQ